MIISTNLPMKQVAREVPSLERFRSHCVPEPNSGCWLWIGSVDSNGYGRIFVKGKMARAHVMSYQTFVGTIPEGLEIDHLCRVRCCVNPQHLEAVTHAENMRRGMALHRSNQAHRAITICPHGHEYTESNTYFAKDGTRHCKACNREHSRRYEQKKNEHIRSSRMPLSNGYRESGS